MPGPLRDVIQRFDIDSTGYDAGIARMIAGNRELIASVRDVTRQIAEMRAALGTLPDSKTIRISVDTGAALGQIAAVKSALDGIGDKEVTVAVRYVSTGDRPGGAGVAPGGDGGFIARSMEDARIATARLVAEQDNLTAAIRRTADAHTAVAEAVAAASRGGGGGAAALAAAAGAAAGGRGGGGGGAAAAAAAAGAAAGGGGGGGGGGGFVPWAGGGWNAVRFWGMMSAEVLSTVIPAAVAAGAATLVGMQGGEQLVNRNNAIFTTAEAIGKAYGQTAGSFIVGGPNGSALQNAQNAATGGVYELAGAGINLLRTGAGSGLATQGVGTIGMLDRAAANALINFQANGTGAKLATALGGGTEYLRQFGAIGGNLGNTFLNLAPNLPGIGSDLLGGLMGGTGLLATGSRDIPGPMLGAMFAAEAGSRWGPAILGGKGLIGRMLGLAPKAGQLGGIGGLLQRAGLGLVGTGSEALGGLGMGIGSVGESLAGLGALPLAAAGAAGYGLWQLANIKPSADRQMSALQGQIDQSGFTQAWQPLAHAIVQSYAGAANTATVKEMTSLAAIGPFGAGGGAWVTDKGLTNAAYGTGFTSQMADLVNSGPQLQKALQGGKSPLSNVSMGQAYQIAQMALLNVNDAFGKNGQLTPTAIQQLQNYGSGIRPMTQSGGAFGAAVSGQYIMNQSAVKDVASLNQAMDSLTTIMEAGPTGLAGLMATRAALPGGTAKALTSFTAPGSAAAWQALASTSTNAPGVITQMQQQMDQYRTAETLGALSGTQATGLAKFQLQQYLSTASQSPAALAMFMQQGAQAGATPYYDPSKSFQQNLTAYQNSLKGGYTAGQANTVLGQTITGTKNHPGLANLPAMASTFLGQLNPNLTNATVADTSQQILAIRNAALGGGINQGAVKSALADFQSNGLSGGNLKSSFNAALAQAGVSQHMIMQIDMKYNIGQPPKPKNLTGVVTYANNIPAPKPKDGYGVIHYANSVPPVPHPVGYGTIIYTASVQGIGSVRTVSSTGSVGSLGGHTGHFGGLVSLRGIGRQTGGRVPGTGSGDIIPAMLEPGEAVVPRNLVPLIAPFLAAHGVPGFGAPQTAASHFAAGGVAGGGAMNWTVTNTAGQLPLPGYVQKILDQILGSIAHSPVWHQFGLTFMGQFASSIKNLPTATKNIASALVNQIATEVTYAKNVASAAQQGQGYGPQGLISGMNVTPGTGNGTVFEQMQSYLQSVQSFTADIAGLRKGGLNKDLIAQMVAAGPVQGDALAKSVTQDYGGIKGVNSLWAQIGKASSGLGAQAAMAQYGGLLAPNLKSGSFTTNNVSISVNAQGGATLSLTTAQINALVAEIQAKLLQQARRNPQTGVKAAGKSA